MTDDPTNVVLLQPAGLELPVGLANERDECCNECHFWNPIQAGIGSCRRWPPMLQGRGILRPDGRWDRFPETDAGDWCGEFEFPPT